MKLKVGDIFTIPVINEKTGFGQIIKIPNKHNFIIGVFETLYSGKDWPSLKEIIQDRILFLGYTMDALLYHKLWQIIGNDSSNLIYIKLPYFKIGTPPKMNIVTFNGDFVSRALIDEYDKLEFETVIAPIRYENALKAYHKLDEWREDYNKLLYERTLDSIKIVERK